MQPVARDVFREAHIMVQSHAGQDLECSAPNGEAGADLFETFGGFVQLELDVVVLRQPDR